MPRPPADPDLSRERTLLAALALSAWGPLATGAAVLLSQSTTQVADFVRRTVELAAIAIAWAVFRRLRRRGEAPPAARARLERWSSVSVALALALSGVVTLALGGARLRAFEPGGDVRLGLLVALLGLATNAWFWRRYASFARARAGRIMDGQRRLYRAKVAVDAVVAAALGAVALAPAAPATRWVDLGGAVGVGLYLLWSAVRTATAGGRHGQAVAAGAPRGGGGPPPSVDARTPMP